MSYHTPDFIWEAFGAPDFESYTHVFVVEGRFHKDVPEAVRESYTVAEHIMAHAYYHYPMYEEGLVKLLRTLEMGVRMRCEQVVEPGMIRGTNTTDGMPVTFFETEHPVNQTVSEQFQTELASVEPVALSMFQRSLARAVEQKRVHCRCAYWCGVGVSP